MNLITLACMGVLFFIFTPGILLYIPSGKSIVVAAFVHSILFTVAYTFIHVRYIERFDIQPNCPRASTGVSDNTCLCDPACPFGYTMVTEGPSMGSCRSIANYNSYVAPKQKTINLFTTQNC